MDNLEHHSVDVEGTKVHYVEGGEGPNLILIHGWFQSWREFSPLLSGLSRHFHLIALDLPGFGASERLPRKHTLPAYVDFLEEFVEKIVPGKFHLCGAFTGGLVSALFAAQNEKVERLILIKTPPYFPDKPRWRILRKLAGIVSAHPTLEKFAEKVFARKNLVKVLAKPLGIPPHMGRDAEPREVKAALESLSRLFDIDLRKKAKKIKSPTLLVVASGDSIAPPQMVRKFSHLLPQGRFEVIEEESHFNLLKNHCEELEKLILPFLTPPWYRRLWERLRGFLLPSIDFEFGR